MSHEVFQDHLNLTSLVTILAAMLDLLNESRGQTVGHVGWHGLTAGWAVCHSFFARSAHDVSGGAAGHRKVSRNVETHWALQMRLNPCHGAR